MLKERKCLMCKHLMIDRPISWEHKCKAYPDGIPEDIYNDDSNNKNCNNDMFSFERNTEKRKDIVD